MGSKRKRSDVAGGGGSGGSLRNSWQTPRGTRLTHNGSSLHGQRSELRVTQLTRKSASLRSLLCDYLPPQQRQLADVWRSEFTRRKKQRLPAMARPAWTREKSTHGCGRDVWECEDICGPYMHTEQTVNAWKTFRGAISKAAPEGQEYVETVESLAVARAQVGDAKGAAKALAALAEADACAAACSGAMVKARNVLWAKAPRHAVQLADAVLAQRHTITAWTVDATFTRAAAARWQAEKDADDSSAAAAATTPRVVDADEMLDNALERFPAVGALLALGKHVVQGSLTEAGAHDDENALRAARHASYEPGVRAASNSGDRDSDLDSDDDLDSDGDLDSDENDFEAPGKAPGKAHGKAPGGKAHDEAPASGTVKEEPATDDAAPKDPPPFTAECGAAFAYVLTSQLSWNKARLAWLISRLACHTTARAGAESALSRAEDGLNEAALSSENAIVLRAFVGSLKGP